MAHKIPHSICPSGLQCPIGLADPTGKGCPHLTLCRLTASGLDVDWLTANEARHHLRRGARLRIAATGQPTPFFCVVQSGMIAASTTLQDGRRQLVHIFVPGGALWPGIGDAGDFTAEVIAEGELRVFPIPPEDDAMAASLAPLTDKVRLKLAGDALETALAHVMLLGRYTGIERLASFLADMATRVGVAIDGGYTISLPMARQDIADYIGLTAETVSRLFTQLREMGVLRLQSPTEIEFLDYPVVNALIPEPPKLGLSGSRSLRRAQA